ncbi:hypothetical protein ACFX2C_018087 [Malus domestica]
MPRLPQPFAMFLKSNDSSGGQPSNTLSSTHKPTASFGSIAIAAHLRSLFVDSDFFDCLGRTLYRYESALMRMNRGLSGEFCKWELKRGEWDMATSAQMWQPRQLLTDQWMENIMDVLYQNKIVYEEKIRVPLSMLDDHPKNDLVINGADEINPNLDLVKGRGGARPRENMMEASFDTFVVVGYKTKLVTGLGGRSALLKISFLQAAAKSKSNGAFSLMDYGLHGSKLLRRSTLGHADFSAGRGPSDRPNTNLCPKSPRWG